MCLMFTCILPYSIDNREEGGIGNACTYIIMVISWCMLVTARPLHTLVQFNTLYSLVYDNNQTRTKCKAIKEINQTVFVDAYITCTCLKIFV